jgi:lysophospholipase L1-like esterase
VLLSLLALDALSACSGAGTAAPGVASTGGATAAGGSSVGSTVSSSGATATGGEAVNGGGDQGGGTETAIGGTTGVGGGSGGTSGQGTGGDLVGTSGSGTAGGEAGGAAGNSGGEGGGAPNGGSNGTYNPCPPKGTPCRIMPMGDSITEGFRSTDNRGGYRSRLFHLTLSNKKSITFVGSAPLWGPDTVDGVPFPKQNEGIGGRRIDDLINIVPATSTAAMPNTIVVNKPHMLLLEIGTNNFSDGANTMANKLATLLDKIIASDPNLLVVLAKIIPTTTASTTAIVKAYDDMMPALVAARANAGKHIILTDMYTPFISNPNRKTEWMADDFHPNDAGYTVMAQTWYDTIGSYLP